jgi:drug/metabolite transporter (DMT)-like permease
LTTTTISFKPSAPLLGNLLTLVASFGYGLYQVLYKIYAALPSDPEVASDPMYEQIPEDVEDEAPAEATHIDPAEAVYPPPFGFHPNLLTSLLGFTTLITLWIPIPFLHWSGAELFRVPPNALTVLSIAGIALSGVVFNAGLMVNVSMSISSSQAY